MAEEVRNALATGGGGWRRPFLASNPEWEGVADRVTNCHTNVSSTVYDASLPPPPTSKCIFNTILLLFDNQASGFCYTQTFFLCFISRNSSTYNWGVCKLQKNMSIKVSFRSVATILIVFEYFMQSQD